VSEIEGSFTIEPMKFTAALDRVVAAFFGTEIVKPFGRYYQHTFTVSPCVRALPSPAVRLWARDRALYMLDRLIAASSGWRAEAYRRARAEIESRR